MKTNDRLPLKFADSLLQTALQCAVYALNDEEAGCTNCMVVDHDIAPCNKHIKARSDLMHFIQGQIEPVMQEYYHSRDAEIERLRSALRVIHTWVDYKDARGFRSALDPEQIAAKCRKALAGGEE